MGSAKGSRRPWPELSTRSSVATSHPVALALYGVHMGRVLELGEGVSPHLALPFLVAGAGGTYLSLKGNNLEIHEKMDS